MIILADCVFLVFLDQKVSLLPEISTEESHEERERSPSPAKNNPSQILSIFNLVRPFTLRQLRELLSKTGSVVEEGFWINKIKSHCYVTVGYHDKMLCLISPLSLKPP